MFAERPLCSQNCAGLSGIPGNVTVIIVAGRDSQDVSTSDPQKPSRSGLTNSDSYQGCAGDVHENGWKGMRPGMGGESWGTQGQPPLSVCHMDVWVLCCYTFGFSEKTCKLSFM